MVQFEIDIDELYFFSITSWFCSAFAGKKDLFVA